MAALRHDWSDWEVHVDRESSHKRILTHPTMVCLFFLSSGISTMAAASADGDTNTQALADNAAFMDKYSRQIGAYGIEAMSKLIQLKVGGPANQAMEGHIHGGRMFMVQYPAVAQTHVKRADHALVVCLSSSPARC